MRVDFTAKCIEVNEEDGYRFRFFCAYCDASHTTGWIRSQSEDMAREIAKTQARLCFNHCARCGRWVCDEHYNMDEMLCTECALDPFDPMGAVGERKARSRNN